MADADAEHRKERAGCELRILRPEAAGQASERARKHAWATAGSGCEISAHLMARHRAQQRAHRLPRCLRPDVSHASLEEAQHLLGYALQQGLRDARLQLEKQLVRTRPTKRASRSTTCQLTVLKGLKNVPAQILRAVFRRKNSRVRPRKAHFGCVRDKSHSSARHLPTEICEAK